MNPRVPCARPGFVSTREICARTAAPRTANTHGTRKLTLKACLGKLAARCEAGEHRECDPVLALHVELRPLSYTLGSVK